MPLSASPNRTMPYYFDADGDVPRAQRPALLVRFMSSEDVEKHADLMRQARDEPDNARAYDLIMAAIDVGVAGWKNVTDAGGRPVSYSHDALMERVTVTELWTLAWSYPDVVKLARDDKVFYERQRRSDGAPSAGTATGA